MIGRGDLCQGFGMLQSRSPVLMNAIYTYQMCHWVTCQIFYIMPFCRTPDSWRWGVVSFNALGCW